MGLNPTPGATTVSVGGVALPLAALTSAVDALAPETDSCLIEVPWGRRRISGATNPAEVLPAIGSTVIVTHASGYTWRGLLSARRRAGNGSRRVLRLAAHGPGLALDRAYIPTFARATVSGVGQMPGGPRFAPGTRSATTDGPGGTRYLSPDGGNWTVAEALAAYLAHVPLAGLPTITLDAGSSDLSRRLPDIDLGTASVHAGLQEILGYRLGLSWRCLLTASGWVLRVRSTTGTGTVVDLTGGDLVDYEVGEDGSAALAELEVRSARRLYAVSVDGKASGSLSADWTTADETSRAAGDRSSPAFRRFKLASFALPDGSSSLGADLVPTLPIAAETTLSAGSSPWLLFAQKSSDSSWEGLQGLVSIHVGAGRIWIEGIDPAQWATWNRIRLTMALSPRSYVSAVRTGGSGLGRGLAVVATRHAYAAGATTRVSGSSLASVTGSVVSEDEPVDDEADALWANLSGPQTVASWSRRGVVAGGPEPGDRLTGFRLPVPGATPEDVAADCICSARRIVHVDGRPQTTWEAVPRPFATGALTR